MLLFLLACGPDKATDSDAVGEETAMDTEDSATDTGDTVADTSDSGTDTTETSDSAPADNCAPGPDGDGDGWTVEAGDCDDCDAIVFPGAPELCDGWDQDCDGVPIGEGGCAEGIDFADYPSLPSWIGDEADSSFGFLGVSPLADGEDLLVTAHLLWGLPDGGYAWAYAVNRRLPTGPGVAWPDDAELVTWSPSGWGPGEAVFPMQDHDGDGRPELLVSNLLFALPESGRVLGDFQEVAQAYWAAPEEEDDFATEVASGDLDGDGVAEIAFVTEERWEGSERLPSRIYLVRGRVGLEGDLDPMQEVVLTGTDDGLSSIDWSERVPHTHVVPDLDGDGSGELMIDAGVYGFAVGSGAALLESDGGAFVDLFEEVQVGSQWVRPACDLVSPGDLDGDGVPDLGWVQVGETDDDDCMLIVDGRLGGPVLDITLQQICKPDANASGYLTGTHDLDGDGVLDPNFYWSGYAPEGGPEAWTTHFIVPTTRLEGGRVEVAEVGFRVGYEADTEGEKLATADLDDDGFPELLSSGPRNADGWNEVRFLAGFPVPFDDPSRW